MATTQTYAGLTAEQKTFYDRTLLSRLIPNLYFYKYGQKKTAPKNEGDTVNFRRFNSLEAATTPLTEGVVPAGNTLSITAVTAKVEQYGDFVQLSDKLDMVGIDPVATEAAEVLGEQGALTVDTVICEEVSAGTNVIYAGSVTGTASVKATDVMTSELVRKAVRALRRANAKPVEGGYYIGLIHPDVAFDIMNDPLWQDVSKYNGGTAIMKGEIGKLGGVRFIETTNAKVKTGAGASSADVHCSMIIGKDAYGVIDIEGSSKPQTIIKPAGSAGTADPLNQLSTVGWKAMFTAKRLNELCMVRVETGATA